MNFPTAWWLMGLRGADGGDARDLTSGSWNQLRRCIALCWFGERVG